MEVSNFNISFKSLDLDDIFEDNFIEDKIESDLIEKNEIDSEI